MHYQWVWELSFTVLFILLSQRQSYLHWTSFRWTTWVDWPKLRSINEKHSKSLTELPKREGEGSIRTVIFLPQAPSPQFAFHPCEFFFFAPAPLPPLPRYISLERKKREIRVYRAVTFPNMNDFSAEYIKDLVITQRKTHSEVSFWLKERFPDKKGFCSRSVRRFFFENGISLHNRLSNDEL